MATVIQATTMNGQIVDRGRWPVEGMLDAREGRTIQVNFGCKDRQLLAYVSRQGGGDCAVDSHGNGKGEMTIILGFRIGDVRQMLDARTKQLDTMVMVRPANRIVEGVMMYLLQPEKCDLRFVEMIRRPG